MLLQSIIEVYTEYTLAYSDAMDKYNVNQNEEDCVAEDAICDEIYNRLNELVVEFSSTKEVANDILDILAVTEWKTNKIDMANNLKNFFNYIR